MRVVVPVLLVSISVVGCGIFTKSSSGGTEGDGQNILTEEHVNKDVATTLSVTEGDLAGTEVLIPAGALAVNAQVSVTQVETPEAFSANSDVTAASQPLQISATGDDGADIGPMEFVCF